MYGYCVSYDLRQPDRNYTGLFERLKSSPSWWHYLESTWLIATNESATQLANRLAPAIDRNDLLLVIEVRRGVGGWLPRDAWNWITKNVPA